MYTENDRNSEARDARVESWEFARDILREKLQLPRMWTREKTAERQRLEAELNELEAFQSDWINHGRYPEGTRTYFL